MSKNCMNSSGSDGMPPNNNQKNDNKKKHYEKKKESLWENFLRIIKTNNILGSTFIDELDCIQSCWRDPLKDVIGKINNSGYYELERIVNITQALISVLVTEPITPQIFLFFIKFVLTYVHEQIQERLEAYTLSPSDFPELYSNFVLRQRQIADIVTSEIEESYRRPLDIFEYIARQITANRLMMTINPQFVDIYSAIYHYYKHRIVPESDEVMNVIDYFNLIRGMQERLEIWSERRWYQERELTTKPRIVYERYQQEHNRRVVYIVKTHDEKRHLSSCYYEYVSYDSDENGDEWINETKLP